MGTVFIFLPSCQLVQQLSATSCLQDLAVCDDLPDVLTNAEMIYCVYEVVLAGNDKGLDGGEQLGRTGAAAVKDFMMTSWDPNLI